MRIKFNTIDILLDIGYFNFMNITVQKYRGTSLGSIDRIKAVADRIIEIVKTGQKCVVVVSAMGKTTDELIRLSSELSSNPKPREYDALISTGENVSASLLAIRLNELNTPTISLTGFQAGVTTESNFTKAKILNINPKRVHKELETNDVVVITGFQGINDLFDITTIGRGGSDTSAVAIAAALNVNTCEILTDVDGIYTTDPNKVKDAQKLSVISYDEMLELASLGQMCYIQELLNAQNKIIFNCTSDHHSTLTQVQ